MLMLLMVVILVMVLLGVLFLVNLFISELSLNREEREEHSSYECGFEHNSLSRIPFSLRYFMLTIVFLIFDMEIALLLFLPLTSAQSVSQSAVLIFVLLFIFLLFLGLLYEWVDGSLDWVM